MGLAKELNRVPLSDSTPEHHFEWSSPTYHWIEFEKNNGGKWRGSFSSGDSSVSKVLAMEQQDEFLVNASGKGYWVNNEHQSLKFGLPLEQIILASTIHEQEVLLAHWTGFYILNASGQLQPIDSVTDIGVINGQEDTPVVVDGRLDASCYQWEERRFEFNKES